MNALHISTVAAGFLAAGTFAEAQSDPRLTSWFTDRSTQLARLYQTDAAKTSGTSVTTWTNGTHNQSAPAYCGVQEVSASADWVYFRTTGLGSHVMGPWYLNAARTATFPNLPVNGHVLYRIPRTPVIPTAKTTVGFGTVGYFVDGVSLFDSRDSFAWTGSSEAGGGGGTGAYFWRDAFPNEGVTFDPAAAHQENTGTYHYHASPWALRHLLGDHVDYNAVTKSYAESPVAVVAHSPIIGWVRDGLPLYGPYGYGDALDASSPVRRMRSGYALRNGQNGTDNLASTGRGTLPAWALRAAGTSGGTAGPAVSTTYPLGRYTEDYAYLGDVTNPATGQLHELGTDFDLNEWNVRWCVTPEFPQGTWAYFNTVNESGVPVYPYNVGRQFFGSPTGGAVTALTETVTPWFAGGPETQEEMRTVTPTASGAEVAWTSVEGAAYKVESTEDLATWTTVAATAPAAAGTSTVLADTAGAAPRKYYRVTRASLATYDAVTGTGGGGGGGGGGTGIVSAAPATGTRGTSVTVTITLDAAATPAPPPANAPVLACSIGTLTATGVVHVSQTQVRGTFAIPAGAAAGAQAVSVTFPGPPANPTQTITYTLADGFTIQ